MHAAAVGLVYDITGRPKAPAGRHDVEERRASSICVMKIYEGKIAQTDMVVCVPVLSHTRARSASRVWALTLVLHHPQRHEGAPA